MATNGKSIKNSVQDLEKEREKNIEQSKLETAISQVTMFTTALKMMSWLCADAGPVSAKKPFVYYHKLLLGLCRQTCKFKYYYSYQLRHIFFDLEITNIIMVLIIE